MHLLARLLRCRSGSRSGGVRVRSLPSAREGLRTGAGACLLLTAAAFAPAALSAQAGVPLKTVAAVRRLQPEEARERRPVVLTGSVMVSSGWKNSFFLRSGGLGISVDRPDSLPRVKRGEVVEIHGVTGAGSFAPVIQANTVRVLREGTLPSARIFSASELAWGVQDSQWIAVRGIVRSAEVKFLWGHDMLMLSVDLGSGSPVAVHVQQFAGRDYKRLIGSTVTVQGVCGTVFNDRRQFVGVRLFVDSLQDVQVNRLAPADPFDVPARTIATMLRFDGVSGAMTEIKIGGTVTWARARDGFYLQDGFQGLFVETKEPSMPPVGSRVTVVGYPAIDHDSPALHAFAFRVEGTAAPIVADLHSAGEMIAVHDGFVAAPFDSVLVDLQGKLIDYVPGPKEGTLLLQDGTALFRAKLPEGVNDTTLQRGSVVRLRGVCSVHSDETQEASSFELRLRSTNDIVELKGAPWWTTRRATWLSSGLGLVLAGMLAWVSLLRKDAHLRTLVATDALTGLYNRRGFLLLGQKQLEMSLRNRKEFLLFYIDLDHFKEVNDVYGHREGDAALKRIATVLREAFRESDILGRLGGDEFAVLVTDASGMSRGVLEERVSMTLQRSNAMCPKAPELALSLGMLVCDRAMCDGKAIEDLLERADGLMYAQKRRNRVERTLTTVDPGNGMSPAVI